MGAPTFFQFVVVILLSILILLFSPKAFAASTTKVDVFQITDISTQESMPLIYQSLVVYRRHGADVDIYGYDLDKEKEFPLVLRPNEQVPTGLFENFLVYDDYVDISVDYSDVRMLNVKTGKDILIAGGPGNQTSGVTNGNHVVYIDGTGACGKVMSFNLPRVSHFKLLSYC